MRRRPLCSPPCLLLCAFLRSSHRLPSLVTVPSPVAMPAPPLLPVPDTAHNRDCLRCRHCVRLLFAVCFALSYSSYRRLSLAVIDIELRKIGEAIDAVDVEIKSVGQEIKDTQNKADDFNKEMIALEKSPELSESNKLEYSRLEMDKAECYTDKAALRQEEYQLRQEKDQLRQEKNRLRQEKFELLRPAPAAAAPVAPSGALFDSLSLCHAFFFLTSFHSFLPYFVPSCLPPSLPSFVFHPSFLRSFITSSFVPSFVPCFVTSFLPPSFPLYLRSLLPSFFSCFIPPFYSLPFHSPAGTLVVHSVSAVPFILLILSPCLSTLSLLPLLSSGHRWYFSRFVLHIVSSVAVMIDFVSQFTRWVLSLPPPPSIRRRRTSELRLIMR